MPEITKDIREIVEYGSDGVDCKDADDLLQFVSALIREHDDDQLPVDAEWLGSLDLDQISNSSNEKLWRYSPSALSTVVIDVSWVDNGSEEQWTVFVNNHYFSTDPTRGDVRGLLKIVGGE